VFRRIAGKAQGGEEKLGVLLRGVTRKEQVGAGREDQRNPCAILKRKEVNGLKRSCKNNFVVPEVSPWHPKDLKRRLQISSQWGP